MKSWPLGSFWRAWGLVCLKHSSDRVDSRLKRWIRFDWRPQEVSTSFSDLTSVCFFLNVCCASASGTYVSCLVMGPCFPAPAPLPRVCLPLVLAVLAPTSPQPLSGSASSALCTRCSFLSDPSQARSRSSRSSPAHLPRPSYLFFPVLSVILHVQSVDVGL